MSEDRDGMRGPWILVLGVALIGIGAFAVTFLKRAWRGIRRRSDGDERMEMRSDADASASNARR